MSDIENDLSLYLLSKGNQINDLQQESLRKSEEYLKKNKILELFDELIAKLIADRPDDIRDYLAKEVKKVKMNPKASYFSHKDFDAMFENYNILNTNGIPICYLFQGLKAIGINIDEKTIETKYLKLKGKKEVIKNEFIDVLTTEYQEKLEISKK